MTVEANKPTTSITINPRAGDVPQPVVVDEREGLWGSDGFTFSDFLDMINPLQHIPIVGTIYREITGDQLSKGARMVGGTLLGGAFGFAAAAANSIVEGSSGKDIGENVIAVLTDDDKAQAAQEKTVTELASLEPAAAATEEDGLPTSNYDNPPPSPYNKKASKLYRQRQGITEAQQLAMRYEYKLRMQT